MRLLVHMDASRPASSAVQSGLATNAKPLRAVGVLVPTTGRAPVGKNRVAHDLLAPSAAGDEVAVSATWRELARELSGATEDTALVSSALLASAARDPATRPVLDAGLSGLRDAGIEVTVLYVVRDQLTQLNAQYVDVVARLVETQSFVAFSRQVVRSGELDLHQWFSPWYDGPLQLIAVPYTSMGSADPLTTLLRAGHVDVPDGRIRPGKLKQRPQLGPLGVEVMRLLGQHLRSIDPDFKPGSSAARQVADMALRQAEAAGWAEGGFWGWSPGQARQVAKRMQASNRLFSQAVWGSDWPLTLPLSQEQNATTLLATPAPMLGEVQRHVTTLVRAYMQSRSKRGRWQRPRGPQRGKGSS